MTVQIELCATRQSEMGVAWGRVGRRASGCSGDEARRGATL